MKITSIKAQVKNPERLSIYVDETYAFSLSYSQLLDQKLHTGLELTEAQLADLKHVSDFGKAYERTLNYAMLRPRSIREVQDYCRRKQIAAEDAQAIITKLIAKRYVDDHVFARAWVESRALIKHTSKRKLWAELMQKGVHGDIISEVLAASEVYDEEQALRDMITKKRRLARYQDSQKLLQYLVRQGFALDDVKRALAD